MTIGRIVHVYEVLLSCRFDIVSLSPDAAEDESGIKRAAENSEFIFITTIYLSV